jgi:hypothetical protein
VASEIPSPYGQHRLDDINDDAGDNDDEVEDADGEGDEATV